MFLRPEHQAALLDEARRAIRRTLAAARADAAAPTLESLAGGGLDALDPPPVKEEVDPALRQPAGCFVSLHTLPPARRLRGCVGRLDAVKPIIEAVRHAAFGVLEDPRFGHCPVCLEELDNLEIEISVLSPLRRIGGPDEFDLLNEGIYVVCHGRAGCFLPQVARETGWTKDRLLARLCTEKLGLAPDAWRRPDARLHTFTTLILGPEPFVVPAGSDARR